MISIFRAHINAVYSVVHSAVD